MAMIARIATIFSIFNVSNLYKLKYSFKLITEKAFRVLFFYFSKASLKCRIEN